MMKKDLRNEEEADINTFLDRINDAETKKLLMGVIHKEVQRDLSDISNFENPNDFPLTGPNSTFENLFKIIDKRMLGLEAVLAEKVKIIEGLLQVIKEKDRLIGKLRGDNTCSSQASLESSLETHV
mmetsp:Transcript_31133/g.47590  ORF Transcript_31133/g.47590 Transcript_31133/m.47590 type:complete len:126 (+) Transcript_31133:2744-3121(+)